jgi:hypothetical protein
MKFDNQAIYLLVYFYVYRTTHQKKLIGYNHILRIVADMWIKARHTQSN